LRWGGRRAFPNPGMERLPVIRPKWQVCSVHRPDSKKLICRVGFMTG